MLIQNQGFYFKGFEFPAFTLSQGGMLRFWVEVVPQSETATNGYLIPSKLIGDIQATYPDKEIIRICPARVKRSFFDFIQPITLEDYFRNRFNLNTTAIDEILSLFSLDPKWKVKNLGYAHQKIFAIICEFQRESIVSYDYYGFAPDSEEQLTKYVKRELEKGKSAISFDNLYYKPENPDSERITNLDIRQRR
ncbi:hypothetical protein ACFSC6_11335 [Rufibacter sediminis]|uniref:Uncharacterized protein n=1 Tax=Rufibacter sediminis TaxID=2762756 RepID=A0ABR6VUC1_9BACT|nr:hypothetical protein [Rufibacter sediminis]MBC3540472.1 hypothetical protein [Rufibacter sediminis]